jgi:hypothetical protein
MKAISFKSIYPHLLSIGVFFIIAIIFSLPAFQGMVLEQHDMLAVEGMVKNSKDHQLLYGNLPLWNTNAFSGMPNFQILFSWDSPVFNIRKVLSLGLPKPADFFFLACISFYILGLSFNMKPLVSMFSALGYAFAAYNPGIISAGHETKMMALAYAPGVLAGFQIIFSKKYWIGLAVASIFMTVEMTANHPQITYYLVLICLLMGLTHLIQWIKKSEWAHAGKSIGLILLSVIIGVGNAAPTLMNTVDYSKYTMRGGKDIESKDGKVVNVKTTGLDYDYASMWSIRKSEALTLFMPGAFGGTSNEPMQSTSTFISQLTEHNIPDNYAEQLASQLPGYWGGLESTTSSNYLGAIACLLAILGMLFLKTNERWWILGAVLVGIILACGKYLSGINELLFNYFPYYNKFRAPSMALVMPQLVVPLLAGLFVNALVENKIDQDKKLFLKKLLYGLGGTIVFVGLIYVFNDYSTNGVDNQIKEAFKGQQVGTESYSTVILDALMAQRKSMFFSSIVKLLFFSVAVFGILYLYFKKTIKPTVLVIIFLLINTLDLLVLDKNYLNEKNYTNSEDFISGNFAASSADLAIMEDKDPHYRVYNLSPDRFSEARTSYFHRSLGGYHAAKLRNYQDIIETKFSEPSLNMNLLNMLDTRYLIIPPQEEKGEYKVQKNEKALGAAWFVNKLVKANDHAEELKYLDSINTSTTAIIDASQPNQQLDYALDSSSRINLVKYRNDTAVFETSIAQPQFAVFSEVYYPNGWNAYIDGKATNYQKVNYFLRGMQIPAGKHTVEFIFEPKVYKQSAMIANLSGWGLYATILLAALGMFLSRKKETT